MVTLGFFNNLGGWDMMIILGVALLLFGKRLPEVGRSMGKGIVEFKKGLKGIEDDMEEQSSKPRTAPNQNQWMQSNQQLPGGAPVPQQGYPQPQQQAYAPQPPQGYQQPMQPMAQPGYDPRVSRADQVE